MIVFISWPVLLLIAMLWLTWWMLKGMCYALYYIGWMLVFLAVPLVVLICGFLYFATVKWVLPRLFKKRPAKEVSPPRWRGWTPPSD